MPDTQKYAVIWQSKTPHEMEWISEIYGDLISEHIFDGNHEIVRDNCILIDSFINRFDIKYYEKFRGKNCFLVHVLDETYAGGYQRYRNFRGVFRNHHSTLFDPGFVFAIPNGYFKARKAAAAPPASTERKYVWSFVGELNKATRPDMVHALLPLAPSIMISTSSIYGPARGGKQKVNLGTDEYYGVMEDSIFSPAPMGNVNIESYRLYEALEAGSIPVVERRLFLDYYKDLLGDNPIPCVSSWRAAAKLMSHYMDRPAELLDLQTRCTEFWREYKSTLKSRIAGFMRERSLEPSYTGKIYSPLLDLRGFKYVELLKHHNLAAIRRRVTLQVDRLRKQRRWRVSS
jgi:hypothetical protein